MSESAEPILDRLFAGRGTSQFLREHWSPGVSCAEHGGLGRFPRCLAELQLGRLLDMYGDGGVALYDRQGTGALSARLQPIAPGGAQLLLRHGLVMTLPEILGRWPELSAFSRALAAELDLLPDAVTMASCFISPGGETGVRPHFHADDSLLFHIQGDKSLFVGPGPADPVEQWDAQDWSHWREHDRAPATPTLTQHAQFADGFPTPPRKEDMQQVKLSPGTVVYIPGGWWHSSSSDTGQLSISVAIFMRSPSVGELLAERLRMALAQSPQWRRRVKKAATKTDARSAELNETQRQQLQRVVAEAAQLPLRVSPEPTQPIRLQRIPGTTLALAGDEVHFGGTFSEGIFDASPELRDAVRWLVARRTQSFYLSQLCLGSTASEPSARALVRQLVEWGVLADLSLVPALSGTA